MRRRLFRACWKKRWIKRGLVINGHVYCANTTSEDPRRLGRRPAGVYRGLREIRNDFAEADAQRAF